MRTKCVWVIASITALNLLSARAEWIDVKNWSSNPSLNAVGNGIVNDAPAIQAAINSLTNGATLYFPAGTYLLNATINTGTDFWTDLALHLTQPNVTLKGDGPGSVLLQSDCRTTLLYADFKSITNSDNVAGLTIDGLKFQGDVSGPYYSNGVSTASGGLIACAGPASRAKKIILKNVFTNDQGKRAAIYLESLDDVLIESCTFIHYSKTNATMGPGYPTIFVAPAGVGSLRVVNNHYDGGTTLQNWASYGSDGLIYEQGGDDAVIAGNTLRNFRFEGIQANPTRLTITGNNFSSVASPSCTAVEITPNAVWEATNVQITVSGNVASGVLTFVNTGSLTSDNAPQIDCVIANNSVKLGNRDAGLSGLGIILCRGNRVAIRGNTFDNYATAAMIIGGDGLSDSSLNIEGNVLTTVATNFMNAGLWLNYYNGSTPFNAGFRNLIIQNNTINSGNGGAHIFMYANNFSTNTPGRVILGNNIYVTGANTNGYKWVGAQNKSYSNIILHPGTTNWGNYVITDLGPDY